MFAGCSRSPESYPPPAQSEGPVVSKPVSLGTFVAMSNPHADAYIVGDISPTVEANAWRWTFRRPEMQFHVPSAEGWKFAMEFAVAGATFQDTGPVTLAVSINGKPLRKQRYDKPGNYLLEFDVPPGALKPGELNRVAVEPDKVWRTKDGGVLGVILVSAGFRQ